MKELRPINFKEFIPTQRDDDNNLIEGTGVYTKDFPGSAFFHKWINIGNELNAIVEITDGTIDLIAYNRVKFKTDNTNGTVKEYHINALDTNNLIVGFICKGLSEGEVVNQFKVNYPELKITGIKEKNWL